MRKAYKRLAGYHPQMGDTLEDATPKISAYFHSAHIDLSVKKAQKTCGFLAHLRTNGQALGMVGLH